VKIWHFTPDASPLDGVTNGVLLASRYGRLLGFDTQALAQHIHGVMDQYFMPFQDAKVTAGDVLFFHHSVGVETLVEDWLLNFPGRKCLIYHNITPPFFFESGSLHDYACRLGRDQLSRWTNVFELSLADSDYNARELLFLGFPNITTLPLLWEYQPNHVTAIDAQLQQTLISQYNMVFVGRIVPNKCQHELIELFALIQADLPANAHFHLVGGTSIPVYENRLRDSIRRWHLHDYVHLTGQVSDAQRNAYLWSSQMYLSMSQHEGFGIPFLEAMSYASPIAAFSSGAIQHTVGGGGLLFQTKSLDEVANHLLTFIFDSRARAQAALAQQDHLKSFQRESLLKRFSNVFEQLGVPCAGVQEPSLTSQRTWRVEGPFDSYYSLAIVNRELSAALNQELPKDTLLLHQTEGGGDYDLNESYLSESSPELLKLLRINKSQQRADYGLRNLFPPRLSGLNASLRLLGPYGWEETKFPREWVKRLNAEGHGVLAMSHYVKKVLQDAGLTLPIEVLGLGVADDFYQATLLKDPVFSLMDLPSSSYFFHVSSGFPRKGMDILFAAFDRASSDIDEIGLVIKTSPNPHNQLEALLNQYGWVEHQSVDSVSLYRRAGGARWVLCISQDIQVEELIALYRGAKALVMPTRGEGYGLPIAEALVLDCPVIVTGAGGHLDFCDDSNVRVLKADWAFAKTHLSQFDSLWFEPDVDDLIVALEESIQKGGLSHNFLHDSTKPSNQWHWSEVAHRANMAMAKWQDWALRAPTVKPRIGIVTTWHSRCGIAEYSRYLMQSFSEENYKVFANQDASLEFRDDDFVERVWIAGGSDDLKKLTQSLLQSDCTQIWIQFNFSFFNLSALTQLIRDLHQAGRLVCVFFHSTADVKDGDQIVSLGPCADVWRLCERIFVHHLDDLNRLRSWGIDTRATLMSHGVSLPLTQPQRDVVPDLLVTNGFLLPQKGITKLVDAFDLLKPQWPHLRLRLLCPLHPAPISHEEGERLRRRIAQSPWTKDIEWIDEFLDDQNLHAHLSEAEAVVYPYDDNQESSSAAVRFGLASGRPVLVSNINQFQDVNNVTYVINSQTAENLAQSIWTSREIMNAHPLLLQQQDWLKEHDWSSISAQMKDIAQALALDQVFNKKN